LNWIDQHKAGIITFLITGIVTFAMFSIHITLNDPPVAETYIDISPADTEEERMIEEFLKGVKATDKAFNEDASYKEMMKQFKTVAADDFEKTMEQLTSETTSHSTFEKPQQQYSPANNYALTDEELQRFNSIKEAMNKDAMAEHSNRTSTFRYSLKDRRVLYYDTPRYLCESGGKVVVNIIVNSEGVVTDCYINSATETTNACLLNTALEYARKAIFNTSKQSEQLGSVTYFFKTKSS
jgi:hypothetical protein